MTSVLRPNPAAFDGHWYTPAQMAALLHMHRTSLPRLEREGKLPPGSVIKTLGGHRRYDAGKVLAWQQERQDRSKT